MRRRKSIIYYEEMISLERKKESARRRQERLKEYLEKQKNHTKEMCNDKQEDLEPER